MTKNESSVDHWVRAVLGVVVLWFSYASLSGWEMWVGYIIGLALLVTAATGYCWLYQVLGMSTKKQGQ
ncbi:MAG: DUF2892 domain-containing protein [Candidatus Pacebacteria bacterium]|nr:DUF2892 domain-containing protein [Candidatus Paceibacterota bacterium]MDR3583167.1 DUF2892 domain-containing protein [Candidatus Paceibacterota bacterium]